jgi:hypothetical protein
VKNVTARCPICAGELAITRLTCQACDTRIETDLSFPALMRLPRDMQDFVLVFLRCRGELGISYPTVCKRLDLVNELLEMRPAKRAGHGEILAKLERGEITAKEAAELLKGR